MKRQPQLYVRKYGNTDWTLLDLYDFEPIKMNLRVQDVIDPTIAAASYSQTFRVPSTTANGKFFQQVFNVNQTFFDPSKKAQAYINDNGEFYIDGNIQLMNVYVSENTGKIEYEITFMNETSDFATQIGASSGERGGFLTDLDLSKYNHDLNYTNVKNSWDLNLFNGDVLYPLVEWGYGYTGSGPTTQPIQNTISVGGTQSFTNSATPLNITQLKPALRAKAIWDAIFATTDYTYESEFLGTNVPDVEQPKTADDFRSIYVVADKQARAELTPSVGWKANTDYTITFLNGRRTPFNLRNEVYDYGNNYDTSTFLFTCTIPGTYTFRLAGNWQSEVAGSGGLQGNNIFFVFVCENPIPNTPVWGSKYQSIPDGSYSGNFSMDVTFNLNTGDQIKFTGLLQGVQIPPPDSAYIYFDGSISTYLVPAQVNPSAALPDQIKQIDFIRSIVERYKLVFEPSKTKPKHFIITPWNQYITEGAVIDWTNKLNADSDVKITPLFQTQKRFMTFKDQEDADYINYYYNQSWKQIYGQRNMDSQIEVIKDTQTVQGIFAPLPIGPIGVGQNATGSEPLSAATFLIPHIAKDEVVNDGPGKRTPIQPKLRLGYYTPASYVTSSITWYLYDGTSAVAQTKHPLISGFYPTPYMDNPALIDWKQVIGGNPALGQPNYLPFVPNLPGTNGVTNPSGVTNQDNFERWWSKWYYSCYGEIETTTGAKDFSVLFEGEFILNYNDVKNLKFNDIIFVKDAYYLINYINDYIIGEVSACRVQLFKINNLGIFLPKIYKKIIDVCYSPDTLCAAECCITNSAITTLYALNPSQLAVGVRLALDLRGATNAPIGWYRIDDKIYYIANKDGLITSITNVGTSGCICVPPLYPLELCTFGTDGIPCDVCCCQDIIYVVWVADNSSTWYTNTVFYNDANGILRAPDGWYSDGTNYVYLENGIIQQSGACNCNCPIYEITEITLCKGAVKCDAVCCTLGSDQFWVDGTTLADSTIIYLNQILNTAPAGFYFDGVTVVETDSSGNIIAILNPDDCYPCPNEGLNVYFDFYSHVNGTGSFKIEKSYDGFNWMPLNTVQFKPIPAQTPFNYTGAVSSGTFLRGKLRYQLPHYKGVFSTNVYGGNLLDTQNTIRNVDYSYSPPQFTDSGREYQFNVNLTGSDLLCGLTGPKALTCTDPSCIIDGFNSIYNVNTDLDVCCNPLIVTDSGFGAVNNATFFIDSTCIDPPPPPPCKNCGDFFSGSYPGNGYFAYEYIYICNNLLTSVLNVNYTAIDRPNRFTVYNVNGLISTSGWVGYANYPGPWGASLNVSGTGTLSIPYQIDSNYYLLVEAGPANPNNPIQDVWDVNIQCN